VNISCWFDLYPGYSQLALYKSGNYTCTGTMTLIAANEFGGPDYSSLINRAYCLQAGKRYFVQVDGWGGAQGSGSIQVISVPNTVTICHNASSNHTVTLTVSGCALPAHLAHGDYIGSCLQQKVQASDEGDITALSLLVYPNPANDIMNVSFTSENEEPYTLKVVDMLGREIFTQNETAFMGENLQQLNFSRYTSGVYFLIIYKGNNVLQTKILKE
jgi:hypothetical protein